MEEVAGEQSFDQQERSGAEEQVVTQMWFGVDQPGDHSIKGDDQVTDQCRPPASV